MNNNNNHNNSLPFHLLPLLFILSLLSLLSLCEGETRNLNYEIANDLCSIGQWGCDLLNTSIWANGVPVDGDDVVIDANFSMLNFYLSQPLNLNNFVITGPNVLAILNVPSFIIKTAYLSDSSQIQNFDSTVTIRNLKMNSASFLNQGADINVDYIWSVNKSNVVLSNTSMTCILCDFDYIDIDTTSQLIASNVSLESEQVTLFGYVEIENLVVGEKASFYQAVIHNAVISANVIIYTYNQVEIGSISMDGPTDLVIGNGTTLLATRSDSFIAGGGGSIIFSESYNFTVGHPDIELDLTSFVVELVNIGNSGTFINVAFGTITANAPGAMVSLTLHDVSFTETTTLYANISASGITVLKSLYLYGEMSCEGGFTLVNGQLRSNSFSQVEGYFSLSGYLITTNFNSFVNSHVSITAPSIVSGDMLFSNSSIKISSPLIITGDWASDTGCTITMTDLVAYVSHLNVTGDMTINGDIKYSISSLPTTTTLYPLFSYTGDLTGEFTATLISNTFNSSSFTLVKYEGIVYIVYTPPPKRGHNGFHFSGYRLYLTIFGGVMVLVFVGLSIFLINRKRRRMYDVIPS